MVAGGASALFLSAGISGQVRTRSLVMIPARSFTSSTKTGFFFFPAVVCLRNLNNASSLMKLALRRGTSVCNTGRDRYGAVSALEIAPRWLFQTRARRRRGAVGRPGGAVACPVLPGKPQPAGGSLVAPCGLAALGSPPGTCDFPRYSSLQSIY